MGWDGPRPARCWGGCPARTCSTRRGRAVHGARSVRHYAQSRCRDEDPAPLRHAALTRLLDHYQAAAGAAMRAAFPEQRHSLPASWSTMDKCFEHADPATALGWLDAERGNLVAAVRHAADGGRPKHACRLATTRWLYLLTGPHDADAFATNWYALETASGTGDRAAEGTALTNLGAGVLAYGYRSSSSTVDMRWTSSGKSETWSASTPR